MENNILDCVIIGAVKAVVDNGQPVLDGDGLPQTTTPRQLLSAGDHVLYRITVSNNGPAAATGITVSDALPEGVEYVSSYTRLCPPSGDQQPLVPCAGTTENGNYDPASGTWQVMPSEQAGTNLPVWASSTLYILARINDTTKGRTITNRAAMGDYDQIDRDPSNNEASADISVGGTISGLVYNDADADWKRADDGEPPFEGVTLTLLDSNGRPVWRKPSHMASMVFSVSRRRSSSASFKPFCAACSMSWALAARMAVWWCLMSSAVRRSAAFFCAVSAAATT